MLATLACMMQRLHEPLHDPRSYYSSSGSWELFIDPASPFAEASADYVLRVDGRELWKTSAGFTLRDSVVMNDGRSIGYTYDGDQANVSASLLVICLDSAGSFAEYGRFKRSISKNRHQLPNPTAKGILLLESLGKYIIRIVDPANHWTESWLTFATNSGDPLEPILPTGNLYNPSSVRNATYAAQLAETDLILSHWIRQDKGSGRGGHVCLSDGNGHVVWEWPLAGAYEGVSSDCFREILFNKNAVVRDLGFGSFAIRNHKDKNTVFFSVSQKGGQYQIVETRRKASYDVDLDLQLPLLEPTELTALKLIVPEGTLELSDLAIGSLHNGYIALLQSGQLRLFDSHGLQINNIEVPRGNAWKWLMWTAARQIALSDGENTIAYAVSGDSTPVSIDWPAAVLSTGEMVSAMKGGFFMQDEEGNELMRTRRSAAGKWFRKIGPLASGTNRWGLVELPWSFEDGLESRIHLYDNKGGPIDMIPFHMVPLAQGLVVGKEDIYITNAEEIQVAIEGKPIGRIVLGGRIIAIGMSPNEEELLVLVAGESAVRRFAF